MWKGDVHKQVDLTLEVVEAILNSRGFILPDITRATAYFKQAADVRAFDRWRAARGLKSLPVVCVHGDICRDDLLFELEADAWRPAAAAVEESPEFAI